MRYGGRLLVPWVLMVGCRAPKNEMVPPREPVLSVQAEMPPAPIQAPAPSPLAAEKPPDQVGLASWYGQEFAGKKTTNGERFDPRLFTAAHKQLPFGTWVEVRRVDTGRSVRVRINDRGPNGRARHRIIDLSKRAAEAIDLVREGVVQVELRIVDGP